MYGCREHLVAPGPDPLEGRQGEDVRHDPDPLGRRPIGVEDPARNRIIAVAFVRLRVVQIGSSPLAPIFEVVEKPNNWDRQIRQAEIVHVRINTPMVFAGAAKMIADAVQVGLPFVYVRIEDPVDPYPLPK